VCLLAFAYIWVGVFDFPYFSLLSVFVVCVITWDLLEGYHYCDSFSVFFLWGYCLLAFFFFFFGFL
jgi:hypothetical protein